MFLFDITVLVHLHREDSPRHTVVRAHIERILSEARPVGYSPVVLSGFLKVVTHPKVFVTPSDPETALEFCQSILELPGIQRVSPGESHWSIFSHLVRASHARGNLVSGAWLAALAVEHDCTWVTTDRDYSRFPRLRVEHPA